MSRQRREPNGKDACKDFRDGLKVNNDSEGGRGVVRGFPGLVKDKPIRVFECGGVVPEGDQRG